LLGLRRGEMDFSAPVKKYFATKVDSQLLNEINWKIIANGITDINSHQFQFVLQHRKEYEKIASPARVQRKLLFITGDLLLPMVNAKDTVKYFRNRLSAAAMNDYKVDSLLFNMDKMIYENTQNWNGYKTVTLKTARTYSWNDYHELFEMADNFYKHIEDATALAEAAQWAKHSAEITPQYSTYILAAKLFQKSGDKTSAMQMAQQAKDLAAKMERSTEEASEFLK
ncbi:MAG: hypothetical protein LH473_01880, partial [Chitinophagales bacterium]|nr:hypothetical protein [Chitinophagales bacterium]